MIRKSDTVREAVREQNWKKALQTAKDFHIGVTQEQRNKMARAYECIVHPDFYQQIGVDIPEAIEQGKAIVKEYAESTRRKNTMMKWDVKHDKAKRVIDAFLDNAEYWQEREDLSAGMTDEDKEKCRDKFQKLSIVHQLMIGAFCATSGSDFVEWDGAYKAETGEVITRFTEILAKYGFSYAEEEQNKVMEGSHECYAKKGEPAS